MCIVVGVCMKQFCWVFCKFSHYIVFLLDILTKARFFIQMIPFLT